MFSLSVVMMEFRSVLEPLGEDEGDWTAVRKAQGRGRRKPGRLRDVLKSGVTRAATRQFQWVHTSQPGWWPAVTSSVCLETPKAQPFLPIPLQPMMQSKF